MVSWALYNESLVRRGEVILDFDIIDGWYGELERMNEDKKGERMTIPIHSYNYLVMLKRISICHIDKPKVWLEHIQLTKYHQYQITVQ